MKTWPLTFWTPGHAPADDGQTFGCASHGIAAANLWRGPEEAAAAGWSDAPTRNLCRNLAQRDDGKDYGKDHGLKGEVLAGTYAAVLVRLGQLASKPAAAIVLFAQGAGVEAFLERWQEVFPGIPVAGGGAARDPGHARGELLPAAEDVAVLLIAEGVWRVESLNVHDPVGETVEFRADGPRTITHVRETPAEDWQPAAPFFRAWQTACDRAVGDCESITLSDVCGRNVHVSCDGERLHTGADLPAAGRLVLRTVTRPEVARRLAAFYAEPNALVFGCAGLRSLLDAPLPVAPGTLAGFMFGELVTLDGRPQFGNLMAARLVRA